MIGDISGLVAAFDSADPEHVGARSPQRPALTIVSPLVLLEVEASLSVRQSTSAGQHRCRLVGSSGDR